MSIMDSLPTAPVPDGAWYGIVAVTATDFSQRLEVIIPSFDENQRFTNVRWQARNHLDFPERGDECLVIFDDKRAPWMIAWWPF